MEGDREAQLVLKDLDEAQALSTKFGAESHPPKKIETHVKIHQVRLWALAALGEYEKALISPLVGQLNHVSRAHEYLTTALDFDCSHIKALRNRAVASERLGYIHDAASDLRRARMYVDSGKDPKLHEYLKKELDRVEDVGDEQERKAQEAFVKMMRGPRKVGRMCLSPFMRSSRCGT